ncbi:MAG: acetate--CoA ligase family protein [Candidatus Hodarchaeota archaeon]
MEVSPLDCLFSPRSIAIIGASRKKGSVGNSIVQNMISAQFKGKIYPINPKATEILGLKCYKSINDIEGDIDLAIISIPARFVNSVLEEIGKKGTKAVVCVSAGFREVGAEGEELEEEMRKIGVKHRMAILGPNCLGLISTPQRINASFAHANALPGKIAFMSQSGAFCTVSLDWSLSVGLGFSHFVSLGNIVEDCGISPINLLEYWKKDPNTVAVLGYLEEISNGAEFMKAARNAKKPIIVVKSGRTSAGAKAASSHTGSLAGSDNAFEALFKQSAVIRAYTTEELFDYATAFMMPMPRSNRISIVTNAGGMGIMATDAVEGAGLELASLNHDSVIRLREVLPAAASLHNPVDIIGDAPPKRYKDSIEIIIKDENVDGIVVLLSPQAITAPDEVAEILVEIAQNTDKPILTCFSGGDSVEPARKKLMMNRIPAYPFPERAVAAMGGLTRYSRLKAQIEARDIVPLSIPEKTKQKVHEIFNTVRTDYRTVLTEEEAKKIAAAYGIPVQLTKLAKTRTEAHQFGKEIGFPVVMKIVSPDIMHKTDVGGVRLNIEENEVEDVFDQIMQSARVNVPHADLRGVLIERMVPKGKEIFIGMVRDPQVGPLLAVGLGGIYVEVLKDVAFRVSPISHADARAMIEEIRSYPLLAGVRGEPPSDIQGIADILVRVCALAQDFPDLVEMDINPLFVYPQQRNPGKNDSTQSVLVLDVKMTIK